MRYAKPPLTFEQQADLLRSRGMSGDRATILERLSFVNYYRLSGYWWPFRAPLAPPGTQKRARQLEQREDSFAPDTQFDTVWDHYVFDQRLRVHAMEAIERIEVAVRTRLAYHHSAAWGLDAYATNAASLPRLRDHAAFVHRVREQVAQGENQPFVHHFRTKYTSSRDLPIWMAVELMSLGCVVTMYKGCLDDVQQLVAAPFAVTNGVLGSWLLALNHVRNVCAHHGRLWNRALVKPPQLPGSPDWHRPEINITKVYAALAICNYLVNTITGGGSTWGKRLAALIAEHPRVSISDMGFPASWLQSPLWANAR